MCLSLALPLLKPFALLLVIKLIHMFTFFLSWCPIQRSLRRKVSSRFERRRCQRPRHLQRGNWRCYQLWQRSREYGIMRFYLLKVERHWWDGMPPPHLPHPPPPISVVYSRMDWLPVYAHDYDGAIYQRQRLFRFATARRLLTSNLRLLVCIVVIYIFKSSLIAATRRKKVDCALRDWR